MDLKEMEGLVVAALEDIKARDITVLDVRKMTSLFDSMVIASGDSSRQVKALANNVQEKAKQAGLTAYGVEGEDVGEWVLVDLGDVVVHIMVPAVRQYYNLEQLWGAAESRREKRLSPGNSPDGDEDAK